MKKKFIYKEDIIKLLIVTIMLLIFGFIGSHWERHAMYGMSPLWTLWVLIGFPIGLTLRYFTDEEGDENLKKLKNYLINRLVDIRNTIILGIVLIYFAFIVFPVVFLAVVITYTIGALIELDWKHLKKISKKTDEVMDKIVTTLD